MRKFLCRLLTFLIPFYLVGMIGAWFYYLGYQIGEFRNFDQMIEAQREDHSILIGMGYNEQSPYYKLENANYYQAEVIALGTSRVMQFKSEYFSQGFYNCGGAVGRNFDEYLNFIKTLDYTPQVIILGLDQWIFNDEWNQLYVGYTPVQMINRNKISMMRDMIKDLFRQSWDFDRIENYPMNYGFNGRVKDSGYQWDGSYYNGAACQYPAEQEDYLFQNTFTRIEEGNRRFEWGEHVDNETCEYLSALLGYCKENHIVVFGFTPPYAPSVYNRMVQSGNYGYLSEIRGECEAVFKEYGYEYFDYTNVAEEGLDDTYFLDGFHGSEVAYALIVKNMVERDSRIGSFVDIEKLDHLLKKRKNHMMLQDYIHN